VVNGERSKTSTPPNLPLQRGGERYGYMRLVPLFVGVATIVACAFVAFAQEDGFQVPDEKNTYVVTHNLKGLECVKGVGGPAQCAVANDSADEGGYPWTLVKCRMGDKSVNRFAWSLDRNENIKIFEAPTALVSQAKLYKINVRLGRKCMKRGKE